MSFEASNSQGVQAGIHNTQNNYFLSTGADLATSAPQRLVTGNVPQEPPAFQSREDLLAQLRSAGPGVSVVRSVTGMRGVGKTQIAAAYARECIDAGWRLVAWVNAEDAEGTPAQLAAIASQLSIGLQEMSQEVLAKLLRGRLEADGERCLIIFDNVVDLPALRQYLPAAGKAQVVITSASRLLLGTPVAVDVFTEEEALAVLAERTGLNYTDGAVALAAELGYLPLALAQAAAVIAAQRLTYQVYLERLREFPVTDYLTPSDDDPYPRGLAQAVLLSLDAITATDPTGLCRDLLDLIALLSPSGVTRQTLHLAGTAGALSSSVEPSAVDAALGRLATASLLGFSEDGTTVTAHRMVMRVIRERQENAKLAVPATRACILLRALRESRGEEPWRRLKAKREFVSHVIALSGSVVPDLRDGPLFHSLYLLYRDAHSMVMLDRGDSTNALAIEVSELLASHCERVLGDVHPATLMAYFLRAMEYFHAGRYDKVILLLGPTASRDDPINRLAHFRLGSTYREPDRDDYFFVPDDIDFVYVDFLMRLAEARFNAAIQLLRQQDR